MNTRSPLALRSRVIRSVSSLTVPIAPSVCGVAAIWTRSPIPYWRSAMMSEPPRRSPTIRCAPTPSAMPPAANGGGEARERDSESGEHEHERQGPDHDNAHPTDDGRHRPPGLGGLRTHELVVVPVVDAVDDPRTQPRHNRASRTAPRTRKDDLQLVAAKPVNHVVERRDGGDRKHSRLLQTRCRPRWSCGSRRRLGRCRHSPIVGRVCPVQERHQPLLSECGDGTSRARRAHAPPRRTSPRLTLERRPARRPRSVERCVVRTWKTKRDRSRPAIPTRLSAQVSGDTSTVSPMWCPSRAMVHRARAAARRGSAAASPARARARRAPGPARDVPSPPGRRGRGRRTCAARAE